MWLWVDTNWLTVGVSEQVIGMGAEADGLAAGAGLVMTTAGWGTAGVGWMGCTSLLAGDSGVLAFRTATGGGRGLLARVAITWPWAFNNSWGVTAWTCRLWAGAGAATLAEFTTHGSAPITCP